MLALQLQGWAFNKFQFGISKADERFGISRRRGEPT
jgi:hypothetical protein